MQAVPFAASTDEHLLVLDSVYHVMGMFVFSISGHVDFAKWFVDHLAPVLQVGRCPSYLRH